MDDLDLGATVRGFVPGQRIFNRYTLKRQLGRGGMGVVWRARDESLEQDVAIKMLPEMVANDPASVRELKRETSRNQQLSHPHILRVFDFVEGGNLCGITMEVAEGGTLTARRLDQPREHFETAQLADWTRQLCEALDHAHRRAKVVHRDLKPANLMLTADGELKVTDFGIAASLSESVTRVSRQAGSSGTPVYMSPQQMLGEKPAVTDDIYALGATLYELLTGKPPFFSGNVLLQVQSKVPPSMTVRRQELEVGGEPIPREWEQTIAACLAKDPAARPQSAREVAERLGLKTGTGASQPASGSQAPVRDGAPATGATPPGSRPASKVPLIAGFAAVVLALAGLGWFLGVHRPEQQRLAEATRLEELRRTEEAGRLRLEQEKAAQAQRDHAAIVARIDAFADGSPAALRATTDAAVRTYAATADTTRRADVEQRWRDRQAGWEAARRAAARGGIAVRTDPPGAEVRIGAIALETSPFNLKDQKLGRYPVRIQLAGYEDWSGEVEVKENEFANLEVTLVRSTGRVVLTGPAGAEVSSAGRTLGVLPLTLDQVPTGEVSYLVSAPGFQSRQIGGVVARNTDLSLPIELEPAPDGKGQADDADAVQLAAECLALHMASFRDQGLLTRLLTLPATIVRDAANFSIVSNSDRQVLESRLAQAITSLQRQTSASTKGGIATDALALASSALAVATVGNGRTPAADLPVAARQAAEEYARLDAAGREKFDLRLISDYLRLEALVRNPAAKPASTVPAAPRGEFELVPGLTVRAATDGLPSTSGLAADTAGLLVMANRSATKEGREIPVDAVITQINRQEVHDQQSAQRALKPGRNLLLIAYRGTFRYMVLVVDAGQ